MYFTVDGDTDNEEIFYFTTKTGTVGGTGTLNVTGRGYNKHNSSQSSTNYSAHGINSPFTGSINHIVINQKAGLNEENIFTEVVIPPTFADDAAADASYTGGTAPNGSLFYSTAAGAVRVKQGGAWANGTGSADFAATRNVASSSASNGELFRDSGSSNDLSYKDNGGTARNLIVAATGKLDTNRYDFSSDTTGSETTKPVNSSGVIALIDALYNLPFGDGRDGDVTYSSGTTTLTRDMYYNNLSLTGTAILNPDGYKIYVKGTLSVAVGAKIQRNGNNGGNGGGASLGTGGTAGTAGTALTQGTLNADIAGSAGSAGSAYGSGVSSPSGVAANPSYSNISSAAGAGGSAGTSTRGANYNTFANFVSVLSGLLNTPSVNLATVASVFGTNTQYKGLAGASGGAGGASGTPNGNAGGGGGGGGGSGGVIWICAKTVNNLGTFEALGGNGGNGGDGNAGGGGTGGQGGGGGGGGSGGVLYLIHRTLTSLGTVTLTGGTGGTGGTGPSGGGTVGNGATGSTGVTVSIQV
jgi:hypothetical protein